MTIYKKINNYPNYRVNEVGQIKSIKKKIILKTSLDSGGYLGISLWKDNSSKRVRIHSLVAKAFIPKIEGKDWINHKNGIKTDNRVENLEWCTPRENIIHALNSGLNRNYGENNNLSTLTLQTVQMIRVMGEKGIKLKEISKLLKLNYVTVFRIYKRQSWKQYI